MNATLEVVPEVLVNPDAVRGHCSEIYNIEKSLSKHYPVASQLLDYMKTEGIGKMHRLKHGL